MPAKEVKQSKEPKYPRGRFLRGPLPQDVKHYEHCREVREFVEQHMKEAGYPDHTTTQFEAVNAKTRGARTAAVRAAMKHFHVVTERHIYRLIRSTPKSEQFEKDYREYHEYLERERAAEAQLARCYSSRECAVLVDALLPNNFELFVKLANERSELDHLRALFQRSIDDPRAWSEIKEAIKGALTRR